MQQQFFDRAFDIVILCFLVKNFKESYLVSPYAKQALFARLTPASGTFTLQRKRSVTTDAVIYIATRWRFCVLSVTLFHTVED